MASVSADIAERARKNESAILRAFARVSQTRVATLLGVSDATVSRMSEPRSEGGRERPSKLAEIAQILAAAGLKVVAEDAEVFDVARIEALRTLARIGLDHAGTPSGFGELP